MIDNQDRARRLDGRGAGLPCGLKEDVLLYFCFHGYAAPFRSGQGDKLTQHRDTQGQVKRVFHSAVLSDLALPVLAQLRCRTPF